ncbi:unnamed protein product [Sphagnum jensenii]|uniref:Uncharacterized protein n=1 Tax=Sphagnum jensenii TaxID=128206 RepID=A0ABP1ATT5_9BRYO
MKAVQMSRLIQSGSSRVNLYWLIDQFILNLMDDFLEELQQSTDYLLKSLKMDFAIPLDTPKDGHHELDPKHPTIQKGLLWAERGRSRILINQIIAANKLHQDVTEISKLINFNFTDKKSWKILRAGQLACGDNTVFVEYMYDTYMEGGYVVQAWAYIMSKVQCHTITYLRHDLMGSTTVFEVV